MGLTGWAELCEEERKQILGRGGGGKSQTYRETDMGVEVERQSF